MKSWMICQSSLNRCRALILPLSISKNPRGNPSGKSSVKEENYLSISSKGLELLSVFSVILEILNSGPRPASFFHVFSASLPPASPERERPTCHCKARAGRWRAGMAIMALPDKKKGGVVYLLDFEKAFKPQNTASWGSYTFLISKKRSNHKIRRRGIGHTCDHKMYIGSRSF